MSVKQPFPWFGGKTRAAAMIWERFGVIRNYVEPFAGGLGVLLNRPYHCTSTINDLDGYVANFWRSVVEDPDGVAKWADNPVSELDLHARHRWMIEQLPIVEKLRNDPDFYDVKIAGWWVWGVSSWIGNQWCRTTPQTAVPHLGTAGMGVSRQVPHLGTAGMGVSRQVPHLGTAGMGVDFRREDLVAYMRYIQDILRETRVCCGDWSRIVGPSVTYKHGLTAILLDPPYTKKGRDTVYTHDATGIDIEVLEWAKTNGDNPLLRIAYCGYDLEPIDGWELVRWKAANGYNSSNGHRECILFSPACLRPIGDLYAT